MGMKLLFFVGIGVVLFKMITGRWPWQPKVSTRNQALFRARRLLGVSERASREEILVAHRRLVTLVHPDKGGSNSQVHEANAARDILVEQLPGGG
ncbi:MAG: J domain-containing protein [Alteraurantiacibacter sp.]